jgi:Fusaric acid resistance protein-like
VEGRERLVNETGSVAGEVRSKLGSWRDVAMASDPGLSRLRAALQMALSLGVALAVAYGFAQFAHPYWKAVPRTVHVSPLLAAKLDAQHHGVTLLTMVLFGIVTLLAQLGVSDARPRDQALTYAGFPVAMSAGGALGIWLAPHHTAGVVVLALVCGAGTYARRFVPRLGMRAAVWGALLFPGYLSGFLAGRAIPLHEFYWYVAIVSLAAAVSLALHLAVYNPLAATEVPHLWRSFTARGRDVLEAAGMLVQTRDRVQRERQEHRLDRWLARLNETALLTDGQLADPRSRLEADAAQALHERLFDLEILLQKIGRGAAALAPRRVHEPVRARVAGWLSELRSGRAQAAARWLARDGGEPAGPEPDQYRDDLVRRLAELCVAYEQEIDRSRAPAVAPAPFGQRLDDMYASPIVLIGGSLAGSSRASAAAVASGASRLATRLRLDAAAQAAIRVALAVGAAAAVGSAISERRFYWAVIAAFVVYFGTNTVGEQRLKSASRVAGTLVGILLGSLLAHAVGPTTWSLAVIIPALAFFAYSIRVQYGLAVVAITVIVSQVYVQFGEYSNHLLLRRLEITAVGAVIAAVVAVLVFPVATRTALKQAGAAYLVALEDLLERVRDAVGGRAPVQSLTLESRRLDDTLVQMLATARPLTSGPRRRGQIESNVALYERTTHYARNLVAATRAVPALEPLADEQLTAALDGELQKVRSLAASVSGPSTNGRVPEAKRGPVNEYLLRGANDDQAGSHDPRTQQRRALVRLDGTLTELATNLERR